MHLQLQFATTLTFSWWEERKILMVELRCATRDSGKHCVIRLGIGLGIPMMQKSSADSLISSQSVRQNDLCSVVPKIKRISQNLFLCMNE